MLLSVVVLTASDLSGPHHSADNKIDNNHILSMLAKKTVPIITVTTNNSERRKEEVLYGTKL